MNKNQKPKTGLRFSFGYEIHENVGYYEPHTLTTTGTPEPFRWCGDYPPIKTPYHFSADLRETETIITSDGGGIDFRIKDDDARLHLGLSKQQMRSLRDILNAWEPPTAKEGN